MKDYYENMMTKYIENSQMEIIFRKSYFNEIMFVIKNNCGDYNGKNICSGNTNRKFE